MRQTGIGHNVACLALVFTIVLGALPARAASPEASAPQPGPAFTVEDMLDTINVNMADLSNDGRFLAVTASSLRDRIGIDNHRFGDPTYSAPSVVEILVIDTQTAKAQKVFPNKRQVRGLKWSPDASRLAFFVLQGDQFQPVIWERANGKLTNVALPKGKQAADNGDFQWSNDGARLIFALRKDEWRKQAAERFKYETSGPVIVHSSKEPFLAWEDLRRMSGQRSLVAYDVKSNQTQELLPEMKLGSYDLAEDGSFITYSEDVTKKTDYDVIGGTENQIQIMPATGGQSRVVIKSTKGINPTWSKDGRRYAYAKDGNIFFASIDDKEA